MSIEDMQVAVTVMGRSGEQLDRVYNLVRATLEASGCGIVPVKSEFMTIGELFSREEHKRRAANAA